jgi:hypothetical protein
VCVVVSLSLSVAVCCVLFLLAPALPSDNFHPPPFFLSLGEVLIKGGVSPLQFHRHTHTDTQTDRDTQTQCPFCLASCLLSGALSVCVRMCFSQKGGRHHFHSDDLRSCNQVGTSSFSYIYTHSYPRTHTTTQETKRHTHYKHQSKHAQALHGHHRGPSRWQYIHAHRHPHPHPHTL